MKNTSIPYGVLRHFQVEVAKVVSRFPGVKAYRSGGHRGSGEKPGRIWVLVTALNTPRGPNALSFWFPLRDQLKAALAPLVATFSTLKLPGERVPRCTYTIEVDAQVDAIPFE